MSEVETAKKEQKKKRRRETQRRKGDSSRKRGPSFRPLLVHEILLRACREAELTCLLPTAWLCNAWLCPFSPGSDKGDCHRASSSPPSFLFFPLSDVVALSSQFNSPRHRRGVPLVAARVLAKVDLLLPLLEPARVGLLLLGDVGADRGRSWSFFFPGGGE